MISSPASIRRQFLIPLLLAVVCVALIVTAVSWWSAQRDARLTTRSRLNAVNERCATAKYPLTEDVLRQIRQLSSVEIAVLNDRQSILFTSLEPLRSIEGSVRNLQFSGDLSELTLDGTKYDVLLQPFHTNPFNVNGRYLLALVDQKQRANVALQSLALPIITGLCSLIAIAIVATVVAARIGRRIEKLERQVNRIADGAFELLAPDGPDDAIGKLAKSVNKMSGKLEQAQLRIAGDERARLINLIASGMAHQLRNSLAGATLLLQTCQRDYPNAEEIPMALQQLKLSLESIKRLLAIRATKENTAYRDLAVSEIHRELVQYIGSMAEHMQVEFLIRSEPELENVVVPKGESIVGCLLNLVLNAIEAAGHGGKVICTLTPQWCWEIADNGPGPPPELGKTILEPFVTSKKEGVGLGLPMAQGVAKQLGGDLTWYRQDGWTIFAFEIKPPTND